MGRSYVNDFLDRGRIKKVYMQGDAPFRMLPEDLDKWYVRNSAGNMVPFSAFATAIWIYGPPSSERYNGVLVGGNQSAEPRRASAPARR